ncbi:MAG: hypothetical protein ACT4PV_11260 [Planctomycetaceae bacterium]
MGLLEHPERIVALLLCAALCLLIARPRLRLGGSGRPPPDQEHRRMDVHGVKFSGERLPSGAYTHKPRRIIIKMKPPEPDPR